MDAGNDDSNARKMCKPKGEENWSALAGEQEVALLKVLGFDITPIHNGQVLYDKGRANSYMRKFWGVEYYSQLWCSNDKSVLAQHSCRLNSEIRL